jgi:imidazolonepropionase-like amidohydrolase
MKRNEHGSVTHRAASVTFGLLLTWIFAPAASAADVLIENVTILSPERSQPLAGHVLIRNDRIATVSAKAIPAPPAATRVDGRGKYLTPGLTDSHVHVSNLSGLPPGSDDPAVAALSEAYVRQQPLSYLYFGVTQLIDLAGFPPGIAAFEAQPQRPDLFRCWPAIVMDGYPAAVLDEKARKELLPVIVFEPANAAQHPLPASEDPSRHTPEYVVDQAAASGAPCVKIFIENGFGERSDWPMMSTDTLKRLRAQTRKRGLLLLAHANALDMQRIALDAEVDVIAHGLWDWSGHNDAKGVPAPVAAHLRNVHARKIGFQPTLRVMPATADMFRADTLKDPMYAKVVPPTVLAWYGTEAGQWYQRIIRDQFGGAPDHKIMQIWMIGTERGMRAVRYLYELGHPLLLASDTPSAPTYGNQPGYDTYREMRMMAQSGVPLPAIFQAATVNNARQFKLERDYGTIEAGKVANLLLLRTNPLQTMRAWDDIDRVVLRGKVIERRSLAADR